jgi:hypothetical protein
MRDITPQILEQIRNMAMIRLSAGLIAGQMVNTATLEDYVKFLSERYKNNALEVGE